MRISGRGTGPGTGIAQLPSSRYLSVEASASAGRTERKVGGHRQVGSKDHLDQAPRRTTGPESHKQGTEHSAERHKETPAWNPRGGFRSKWFDGDTGHERQDSEAKPDCRSGSAQRRQREQEPQRAARARDLPRRE